MSNAKTVMSQAANTWAGPTYIEDVFSTYLYTGNGATQTITNGIDLAGEGGLVWSKCRSTAQNNHLVDSVRGTDKQLYSNLTNGENSPGQSIFTFNSDGYDINLGLIAYNTNAATYASWTFRKAPRFFDVVTYTGTGSARTVSHNLGTAPGCIIIKCTTLGTTNWLVYHVGQGAGKFGYLNTTDAFLSNTSIWQNTTPTDTQFYLGTGDALNGSGQTYVAYLFAHDPLGPSGDGSDGLIACGSYTAAANVSVDLGWEPQWVLTKNADDATGRWKIVDNMRGFVALPGTSAYSRGLYPNLSNAEGNTQIQVTPTGFAMNANAEMGFSGTCIYIAIRRGPMRQPTIGTEVFAVDTTATAASGSTPSYVSNFPVDMGLYRRRSTTAFWSFGTRLLQGTGIDPSSNAAEYIDGEQQFDYMIGWKEQASAVSDQAGWMFRRAPGFFDVVAYTGNGVAGRTVPHNLGVAPEMMWVRERQGGNWKVYTSITGAGNYLLLNSTIASTADASFYTWNNTAPTDTAFSLGIAADANQSGQTYIACLFASLSGVSKVGTFVASSGLNVDCGFSSGARFVLVKRIDSAGNWMVVDTARGIISAADPVLDLNSTGAEYSTDIIDPYAGGFSVGPNLTGTFVYYAIA